MRFRLITWIQTTLALGLALSAVPFAESQEERGYTLPPESVRELFERDKNYATLDYPGPDATRFVVPLANELSTLERMGRKTLRLAMLEIRPDVHREWRLDTHGAYGYRIYSLNERRFRDVSVPAGIYVSDAMFSPDGKRLAFLAHLSERSEVWIADVVTGEASSVSNAPVMATLAARPEFGRASNAPSRLLQWTPEGSLLTLLVPEELSPEPQRSLSTGPVIRTTRDEPTPNPTYPFLLEDETDAELFVYHTTSQIAELAPGNEPRRLGKPGMYLDISLSPDGKYILAERIVEPLSYITTFTKFAPRLEILDRAGRVLSTVREMPLREADERDSNGPEAKLPRDVRWRPDGKGLAFLWREEAEAEGE